MAEYRRGITGLTVQKEWHFHLKCPDYPTRGFEVAAYTPAPEDWCPQCGALMRSNSESHQNY